MRKGAAVWITSVSLGFCCFFQTDSTRGHGGRGVFYFTGLAAMVPIYGMFFARSSPFHVITAVQKSEWGNVSQ